MLFRFGEPGEGNPTLADHETVELTIIHAAQRFVDGWHRSEHRRPFRVAVGYAADAWVTQQFAPAAHRVAFIRVAKAIRVGRGHGTAGTAPLIEIVSAILANESQ